MSDSSIYDNGTYLEKNPGWHEEDSTWKASQISKIITGNKIAPSTLCEVGCGAGEILNCLSSEFANIAFSGYEISPQAFEICRTKEKNNLKFHLKDISDHSDQTFDVVMAIDVFEHVEDYFGFLRKLRTRGIYKIFHIPLDLSVQSVLRGSPILNVRESVGHIQYFTKETALATLKDTGYEIVDYFYTGSSLELSNHSLKSHLMKLPRGLFFKLNRDLAVRILGGFSLMVLAK
ncbi:class I SAM-dependent methyltransferase [Nitrosovibrio sp. Nv4]|uniref:class I SAM-dependent methyltransferase n=1 Tax=Nitrosovibrio sp. Nv4 TaxID=1945880 RepID=UPI000BE46750|nr:class I SAM-dependent methyltransferase [Nitrosovibrio sp. Nv4]